MGADARMRKLVALVAIGLSLAACAGSSGPQRRPDASGFGRSRGYYKVGAPYQVNGVWYYPRVDYAYDETGTASWYGEAFNGRSTANGETFDLTQVSAAHKTLQLPSVVEVTNLQNGRALKVRVNDRGPFAGDRIIDLSRRAAQLLGFERAGTAPVRVKIIKEESIKVAEAAMRGDIGQTRLAQASRLRGPDLGWPPPGRTRAVFGRRRPRAAIDRGRSRSPPVRPAPTAGAGLARAGSAAPPHRRTAADRERAIRGTGPSRAARRPAWPTLIASAHAAPDAALPASDRRRCRAVRPDFHPGRDVCGRGEREPGAGALRRPGRYRGGARQCQWRRPVPGEGWGRWRARRRRGVCLESSRKAGFLTPGSSRIERDGVCGEGRESQPGAARMSAEGLEVK